jgi:hypothetical protein
MLDEVDSTASDGTEAGKVKAAMELRRLAPSDSPTTFGLFHEFAIGPFARWQA